VKTVYAPKPGRANGPEPFPFDWEAYTDEWDEGDPVGFGPTEEAAIADLMEKLE
jgi:hypothetical protein